MPSTSFGFQWTLPSLAISLAAVVAVCTVSWFAWRRSGYRTAVGFLEGTRIAIVCFAVFLLNQPETVQRYEPDHEPTVVVLGDQSRSMDTQDVGVGDSPSTPPASRRRAIEPLLDAETWRGLAEDMEIVCTTFASEDGGSETNLHQALKDARDEHEHLRAIVLASDGDWNAGPPPVSATSRLRLENIPVFAIPVGSQTRLPDLELLSFDVPSFGVSGKNVRIPFTIESSLPRDHIAQVELTVSDGTSLQHQVRVAAMGRTSDAIIWKPEAIGDYSLSLSVPPHPQEKLLENNRRETPIAIREEKLRVLVVESIPRWEYRYLRNALSRDPGVEVSCLLFHPGLSKTGGGNLDYIPAFPEQLDELAEYDVVFLGDVGIREGQLTEEQCRLLKGLVEQQASGLVFLPGWQGNMFSLVDSPLGALLPVTLDDNQPNGLGTRASNHFALTELGRRSLLTKLADTPDENMQVWQNLPGFQWHAPVVKAKAGADVLCVHQDSSNEYGRIPLLVTRTFGAGKVLFMGTDGAWRWRRGVEDLYHYRFWGQVVRWMAYQRNMAEGELMRFYYSPEQPQVRQTVALKANVMERSGEPLSKGNVTVRIVAPSGRTEAVRMSSTGAEWGAFAGVFTPSEPGGHEISLRCQETQSEMSTTVFVQGSTLEQVGKPARPEVLEELARVTRGQVLDGSQMDEILSAIAELPQPAAEIRRVQLWSHPLVAATLLVLLTLFWIGRKAAGLI